RPGKSTDEVPGERAALDPDAGPEWTLDMLSAAARARDPGRSPPRCGTASGRRGSAGGAPAGGRPARTPTLPPESQQGADRRALHHATRRGEGPVPQRARPRNALRLPPAPG